MSIFDIELPQSEALDMFLANAELELEEYEKEGNFWAQKEAEFTARLCARLEKIRAAKSCGVDFNKTSSAEILGDEIAPIDWCKKIKFRCSSLEALMKEGRGKSRDEKQQEAEQKLAELQAQKTALGSELSAQYEAELIDLQMNAKHAQPEKARAKAEQKLASFQSWEQSKKWLNHAEKIRKAQQDLEEVLALPEDELSASARAFCEQVFANAYFGHGAELKGVKSLQHGTLSEQYCIDRFAIISGLEVQKNTVREQHELLTGESDCVPITVTNSRGETEKIICEFKSATSPAAFVSQVLKNDSSYHYQVQGYMLLYGCDKAYIVTNLIETIDQNGDEYNRAPEGHKHHVRVVERDEFCIAAIKKRLQLAYDYVLKIATEAIAALDKM